MEEIKDYELKEVTGGTAPGFPATTFASSGFDSPEIPSVEYKKGDAEWSPDMPTDAGKYRVNITVNGNDNYSDTPIPSDPFELKIIP